MRNQVYRERGIIMKQVFVKFHSMEQVKRFLNAIDRFDANFDMGSGRKVVDAKSIIGVCGLDLSEPQRLCYDSDDDRIMETLTPFLYQM